MESKFSFEQFKQLISEEMGLDIEKLNRDTSFMADLGIDSLSLVNFIIKVEKSYNIRFNNEKGLMLSTVGEAYDIFINALIKKENQTDAF